MSDKGVNLIDVAMSCTFTGAFLWFTWYALLGAYALLFDRAKLDEPAKYLGPLFVVIVFSIVIGVANQSGRS